MNESERIIVRRLVDQKIREQRGINVRATQDRQQCEALTWLGGRCQNTAVGSRYCHHHGESDD